MAFHMNAWLQWYRVPSACGAHTHTRCNSSVQLNLSINGRRPHDVVFDSTHTSKNQMMEIPISCHRILCSAWLFSAFLVQIIGSNFALEWRIGSFCISRITWFFVCFTFFLVCYRSTVFPVETEKKMERDNSYVNEAISMTAWPDTHASK